MSTLPLEIDLLGPLCVRQEGRAITRFKTRKTAALLGLMAARPQRSHRREEVIEMLWPEADTESGRNRLRLALSDLRRELEAPTEPSTEARRIIVADRLQVSLNAEAFTTDKARFEAFLEQARKTDDDMQRIAWLTQAADLYRGDFLQDFDEQWIRGERQQIADAYLLALRRLIQALANVHQYDRALLYAQRAVQADPLREETHRSLMQLYAALGRRSEALRQYQQLEARLREDLNAAPSLASQQLYAQLQPAPASAPQPAPASILPPAASRSVATPSTPNAISAPYSLPVYATALVGRQAEVGQVCEMLLTPDTRLVTVTGLGGCGKTRVAVGAGQALLPKFGENVWFVPLAALTDAGLLWEAVAGVLNLPGEPTASRRQQVVDTLNSTPGLLVLDNCEHLGNAASRWIADLLQAAPVLTCLATSRQRLNVSSEYEYGLAPLPTPPAAASLSVSEALAYPSVRLFVDRARQARPSFDVTPINVPTLAALCRNLDGLPLALELAAVWVQTLTPAQIQARLTQRFTLLVSRHHDVPARHRSLRAVLDGSFQMLSPAAQRFFARLSVFRGGWTLDAAQAICEEPDAPECLMQMREQSLIRAGEVGEQMRYDWLETVREYADAGLRAEERAALQQRHADFYASFAAAARQHLYGEGVGATLAFLDAEQPNCRAALEWGMAHPPLGALLANSLASFWHIRGRLQEGAEWFSQALAAAEGLPVDVRLSTTGNAGNFAYLHADYARAQTYYEACLEMARGAGDDYAIAHALDGLGNVVEELGDYEQARRLLDESILKWRELDAPNYLALALSHRAGLADEEGDDLDARHLYEESLILYRSIEKHQGIASMLSNLAGVLLKGEDYEAATPLLKESLTLSRQIGSPRNLAFTLTQMAVLAVRQSRFTQAAQLLGQAAKVREEARVVFNPRTLAEVHVVEDTLLRELGEPNFQELREQGHSLPLEKIPQECL